MGRSDFAIAIALFCFGAQASGSSDTSDSQSDCARDASTRWYNHHSGYDVPSTQWPVQRHQPDCFMQIMAGGVPACLDDNFYITSERTQMYANVLAANYSGWALEQLQCCKAHPSTAERNCEAKYSATAEILDAFRLHSDQGHMFDAEMQRFETGPVSSDPYEACADAATNAWYSLYANASHNSPHLPMIRNQPDCFMQIMAGGVPACLDHNFYITSERNNMYANVLAANYYGWALEQLECCVAFPTTSPLVCTNKFTAVAESLAIYGREMPTSAPTTAPTAPSSAPSNSPTTSPTAFGQAGVCPGFSPSENLVIANVHPNLSRAPLSSLSLSRSAPMLTDPTPMLTDLRVHRPDLTTCMVASSFCNCSL